MTESREEQEAAQRLLELLGGKWVAAALSAAAQLGLVDALDTRPMSAGELADALDCKRDTLERLLGVLAAEGLFQADDDERFHLTALGRQLRSDALGPLARYVGAPFSWSPWLRLKDTVISGTPAFELEHGRDLFGYLASHPNEAAIYNAGVDAFTRHDARTLAKTFDFSGVEEVVDVGGGMGTLLVELLGLWPELRGILFETEHVARAAADRIREAGLSDRCRCVAGNFFESVPAGADIYIVRHIVHNWGDAKAATVLRNCAEAMGPDGRVLVVEGVLLPGHRKDTTRLLDLEMMVLSENGRERTKPELRHLLHTAGLRLSKMMPLASTARLIVAEPRHPRSNM